MAIIISISQGKGGAAKTTTAVNLAGALIELGFKVVLFDWDLAKPDAHRWMKSNNQLDFIRLMNANTAVQDIEEASRKFDYIIFDTPPNYDQNAFKAIMASDMVIIPTSVNYLDQENTKQAISVPILAKKPFKILMSRVKKSTKDGKEIHGQVQEQNISFKTVITDRNVVAQCPAKGQWIGQFARNSESHQQYLSLAEETIAWAMECHARGISRSVEETEIY